jgi:hypothetical protein
MPGRHYNGADPVSWKAALGEEVDRLLMLGWYQLGQEKSPAMPIVAKGFSRPNWC